MTDQTRKELEDAQPYRHLGNPRLIKIKGLKIVEMPECEGGGYALTGDVAERVARSLEASLALLDDTDELKECPFCGGDAVCEKHDTDPDHVVFCNNDDCPIAAGTCYEPTKKAAIAAWNTRNTKALKILRGDK